MYLDLTDAIKAEGKGAIATRYGNLMTMYERISGDDPYKEADADLSRTPLHDGRSLGGLPPDEFDPRPVVLGEANYSEHGANRLGASALMQGLADGYFGAPSTVTAWLAGTPARTYHRSPGLPRGLEGTRRRISR